MRIPPFIDLWLMNKKKRFYLFRDQKLIFLDEEVRTVEIDKKTTEPNITININKDGLIRISTEDPLKWPIIFCGSRRSYLELTNSAFFSFMGYELFVDNIPSNLDFSFSGYFSVALKEALKCSRTSAPILIIGDTGTGKEVLARNIHYNSANRHHPFVALNCASLDALTAEKELFGNVRGAFTNGNTSSKGAFYSAGKGTIFLDNIEDLPINIQPMLLRVIELLEVKASGSDVSRKHKARVIASASMSPKELLYGGLIRKDLYYRLEGTCLYLPELKQMKNELSNLLDFYLADEYSKEEGLADLLSLYDWPGNLREFRNVVERAKIIGAKERLIKKEYFCLDKAKKLKPHVIKNPYLIYPLENEERTFILDSLLRNSWNIPDTARELSICRSTLMAKIKYYQLKEQN
jgi:DNA-binding NtrC family response regulator